MKLLGRILLRVLVILLALIVLAWIFVAAMRWELLGERAYADLHRMSQRAEPPPGRNAFPVLMLAGYETGPLDADAAEAAVAADAARFAAWQQEAAAVLVQEQRVLGFTPFADRGWAEKPVPATDDPRFCSLGGNDCLARVSADPETARAALQEEATRLAQVRGTLEASHLHNPYAPALDTPLPSIQLLRLPLTEAALAAVDGDADRAYAQTCQLLAAARRFDRSTHSFFEKRVAETAAGGAALLLIELRRAYPRAALPADCAEAVAPVTAAEAGICRVMQGEFAMQAGFARATRRSDPWWRLDRQLAGALLSDGAARTAWTARAMAPFCADGAGEAALAGEPTPMGRLPERGSAECYAAMLDCQLLEIAIPAYHAFSAAAVDHAAKLRLVLAAQAVADGRLDPAAAAAAASVPGHPVEFDPETESASLQPKYPAGAEPFVVPLAGLRP